MKYLKYILFFIIGMVLLMMMVVAFMFGTDGNDPYDNPISEEMIPVFKEIPLGFTHQFNKDKSLPVTASCLIDVDNDGTDELFLGGGLEQQDELFSFKDGAFRSVGKSFGLPVKEGVSTLAAASADFDNNGFSDLIISREDGVTIYYNSGTVFSPKKVEYTMASDATPLGFAIGDINKDGFLDIFLSNYIRKAQMQGQNNFTADYGPADQLLMNNGDNTFSDVTRQAGLYYEHNTFMGVFVDIDNDGSLDLIVAHDTGEVRSYKNKGDGTFNMMPNPTTGKFGYPMGIAVGDYNNDGLVDFMFSNTGSTVPHFMASGNIEDKSLFNSDWFFFENKGNFVFEDVAGKVKVKDFEFSWGAVFADMNNDGLQDLMVAENYVALPPHKMFKLPGRMLIQKEDHTFGATEDESKVVNKHYGITPLVTDFNQDGYQDLVWVNIDGPVNAFLNEGGDNNYLQLTFPENFENIGAKVKVVTSSGKTITEDYVIGEGLVSDQSATVHFGLGKDDIKSIQITYIDGRTQNLDDVKINARTMVPKMAVLAQQTTDNETE